MVKANGPTVRKEQADTGFKAGATGGAAKRAGKPVAGAAKGKRHYLPAKERRRLIIEAAQEVFGRASLSAARTRDLAKAANVNQATLFEHFASKEELFMAAVVEPLVDGLKGMSERVEAYGAAGSTEEVLALSREFSQKHLERMIEIYPLLTAALFSEPEIARKLYCEQIVPLLEQSAEAKRVVIRPSIDPNLLSLASFGIFFAIAMDRAFRDDTSDMSGVGQQVVDLLMFGSVLDRPKARD